MNLSKHVTKQEFELSPTAIRLGIDNQMNEEQTTKAILLCVNVFEPIRAKVGHPIKINSGFRSAKLNKKIGGSTTSQHCKGEAMDLDLHDKNIFEWIIKNITFDQLIFEGGNQHSADWFHISYKKDSNRNEVLRMIKKQGQTLYVPYKPY
jgi:zinc D-Ala-D-Ala carboxypeptidase